MNVKIINKSDNALPAYQTDLAAGFDFSSNEEEFVLMPGERKLVSTGIFMELPAGYEMQIRPRSGMAFKHGVTVLNSPGTIDADYRGEIKILLYNSNPAVVSLQEGEEPALSTWNNATDGVGPAIIKKGDRIAQGVISQHARVEFTLVDELSETVRGEGGFGSTGTSTENK